MRPKLSAQTPLVLASASEGRRQQLARVGVPFTVEPSRVDEDALKAELADVPLPLRAPALAKAKADEVSARMPGAVVIGGDQICALGLEVLSKPLTTERAAAQLKLLSGRTHYLHTAGVLVRDGELLWQGVSTTALTMRRLTDADIAAYLERDDVRHCCGSYKIESFGLHLFARLDGDETAIPGLPLVGLLAALHGHHLLSLE